MRRGMRKLVCRGNSCRRGLRPGTPRGIMRDYAMELFDYQGEIVFDDLKIGDIVAVLDFLNYWTVGRVERATDSYLVLSEACLVLFDGRHHEFAAGKPPQNAEIERTLDSLKINIDDVRRIAPYPKLLKTQ